MKARDTDYCTRTEMVSDLYAQVIWLRQEVERLERLPPRIPADGQTSKQAKPEIWEGAKNAVKDS